jgi:hypothetical protein
LIEAKAARRVGDAEPVSDIAVQVCVLRATGVPVTRYEIMHLSCECRHPDLSNLFTAADAPTYCASASM